MSVAAITGAAATTFSTDPSMPDRHVVIWTISLGFVATLLVYLDALAYRADVKRQAKAYADATAVRDREAASYRLMVEAARTAPCPTTVPLALPVTQRLPLDGVKW